MSSVRIITDGAAELTPDEATELDVSVLPLRYSVDNAVYRQDVDISSERLLELVAQGKANVSPLPLDEEDVASLLEGIARSGEEALCVHVADGLVSVAEPMRSVVQGLFGSARIEVIDSLAVSYGQQRIVRAAAEAAADGADLPEVTQVARSVIPHVYTLFYTEEFEYLEKSVDIQPAQAILAAILGVKPLVVLEEGRLLPLEKITPRRTPVDKLADFVSEFATVAEVAILVGPQPPDFDVEELRQRIMQGRSSPEVPLIQYGPLVAASVGPAATGLFVYEGLQAAW